MQPHSGLCKQVDDALGRIFNRLQGAGEKVQGVLPGADYGGVAAGLLKADAGGKSRQAAAYYDSVEFQTPNTCL